MAKKKRRIKKRAKKVVRRKKKRMSKAKKKVRRKRHKTVKLPYEERVSKTPSGWVHEKVFVPSHKFRKKAMITASGKRADFVSRKPRPGTWLIIGCLPKDYDKAGKFCKRTTVHKQVKKITAAQAKRLKAKPGVKVMRNPCRIPSRGNPCPRKSKLSRSTAKARNPQLMVISNPISATQVRQVAKTNKAYKRFHFKNADKLVKGWIPTGWPKTYMTIGQVLRFDVQKPSGAIASRRFRGKKPVLASTAAMKDLYIFGTNLGIPAGKAVRIDYKVPPTSGRNKWASRWWHPHKSFPTVKPHSSGKAVKVSGPKLKVTPRGIVG